MMTVFTLIQLSSCGTVTTKVNDNTRIFYPPLPNNPRIQYLATFNASFIEEQRRSKFSDFVLGEETSELSQLRKPYGVAFYKGKVFVVDSRSGGYMILDANDRLEKFVPGSGSGRMKKPINISIDDEGNRYVTDTGLEQVLKFDDMDNFLLAFGTQDQFRPGDAMVAGDNLYISDLTNHVIHVLNKKSGATRGEIGVSGSKIGELFFPTNLSVTPEGNIVVSDTGNFRIQVFTPKGKVVRTYGEAGANFGQFSRPKGVAVDKEGRIYVVDSAFENVQIFNKEGELLLVFGAPGNDRDSINLPADIFIGYDGIDEFKKYADEQFNIEYIILVSSQFGPNKVSVYGFGTYNR